MISESEKIKDALVLVNRLEEEGHIERNGEEIFFINESAENADFKRIKLRNRHGKWLCEALDAATYLNPENLRITHLVVLPNEFKKQQDKVWEILRVLGIKPDNYHNIFFDSDMNPQEVVQGIKQEIERFE